MVKGLEAEHKFSSVSCREYYIRNATPNAPATFPCENPLLEHRLCDASSISATSDLNITS